MREDCTHLQNGRTGTRRRQEGQERLLRAQGLTDSETHKCTQGSFSGAAGNGTPRTGVQRGPCPVGSWGGAEFWGNRQRRADLP